VLVDRRVRGSRRASAPTSRSALLKTLSPSSACIGESLPGKSRLSPEAVSTPPAGAAPDQVRSSTVTPESTDRFARQVHLGREAVLMLDEEPVLGVLVRNKREGYPLTFSPRSRMPSFPFSIPSRTRRSASSGRETSIPGPRRRIDAAIPDDDLACAVQWPGESRLRRAIVKRVFSVRTARRFSAGSARSPFGTAMTSVLRHTPGAGRSAGGSRMLLKTT